MGSYVANMLSELGDLIEITLPDLKKHHIFRIEITYETKPCQPQLDVNLGHCDGLYWQRNKKMFYSVGQAIFTRQLIPCQDTPTAKTTYTAVITAPEELKVLMSASEIESDKNGTGKRRTLFNQRKPISTYLIVLAIGNFKSKKIGPRSHVWALPDSLKEAATTFKDVEENIKAGEKLLTPYDWENYDIVLVPNFIFAGMENPQLTFYEESSME